MQNYFYFYPPFACPARTHRKRGKVHITSVCVCVFVWVKMERKLRIFFVCTPNLKLIARHKRTLGKWWWQGGKSGENGQKGVGNASKFCEGVARVCVCVCVCVYLCVCECPGCALKYACRKLKLIIYIFKAHWRTKGECRQDVDAGK